MLNLWLVERLFVRVVAVIILSHVCWHVFSPGAEINQNSVMVTPVLLKDPEKRFSLNTSGGKNKGTFLHTDYIIKRNSLFSKSLDFLAENGQFLMLKKCRQLAN